MIKKYYTVRGASGVRSFMKGLKEEASPMRTFALKEKDSIRKLFNFKI